MLRIALTQLLQSVVDKLVAEGHLPAGLPAVTIEDPKDPSHGDFATNFALVASKAAGMPPRQLAEIVAGAITSQTPPPSPLPTTQGIRGEGEPRSSIQSVDVAGPGFINLRLDPEYVASYVSHVLSAGVEFKRSAALATKVKQRINVEFVSVNPNGPITIGSGRGAAFGSTLANVLEAAGHTVHREYYINDGVNSEQMRQFGRSLHGRALQTLGFTPPNEMAYKGEYVTAIANDLLDAFGVQKLMVKSICRKHEIDAQSLLILMSRCQDLVRGLEDSTHDFEHTTIVGTDWPLAETSKLILCSSQVQRTAFVDSEPGYERVFGDALILTSHLGEIGVNISDNLDACREVFGLEGMDTEEVVYEASTQAKNKLFLELLAKASHTPSNAPNWLEEKLGTASSILALKQIVEQFDDADIVMKAVEVSLRPQGHPGSGSHWAEDFLTGLAKDQMIRLQQEHLEVFGVTFDRWSSEQSLHDSGVVEREIDALEAKGAADSWPVRHKLKLAKGGVIEDVEVEEQAGDIGEDEDGEGPPAAETTPHPQPLSPGRGEGEFGTEPHNPQSTVHNQPTLWLRSTKFGDDMDRVIRRKDGRLTYIASDVAYHKDKFNRPANADKLITILGPDHHGYIGRLHAVLAAVEVEAMAERSNGERSNSGTAVRPDDLTTSLSPVEAKLYASLEERDACKAALDKARKELDVIIYQLVRFMKDGKPAPMRKRDGNIYAIIDLIDEIGKKVKPEESQVEQRKVGKDVARFFYLMRSHDTTFDFDLDLAEKQSDENPVFYVQYAHARICSVIRKAEEAGLPHNPQSTTHDLLVHPKETALIKKILDLPHEVSRAAEDYGVHRLTTYGIELARAYHHFYDACRVIQPEHPELSQARLALCEATKIALQATFDLLGIEAPEHM